MATLLTTSKMDPALAARIDRSVRGRKSGASTVRRIVSLARFTIVVTLAFVVFTAVKGRRADKQALERARAELLAAVDTDRTQLDREDLAAVARADSWLARLDAEWPGDVVAEELRDPGALARTLARPMLYVRGPLGGFSSAGEIAESAAASAKDALLLCMLDPPASRDEKALMTRVRIAYGVGRTLEAKTANARRLSDAIVGLALLEPPWSDRVRAAEDVGALDRLRKERERVPFGRTKDAAKAGLLLAAIDEPGDGNGPTELDGEHAHFVRVALVDLDASKVLLRARLHVDPSFVSKARKPTHSSGLDSCALAYDVRQKIAARSD